MEQYKYNGMSEEMQSYGLWDEQADYYGMGISDSYEASNNNNIFYSNKNISDDSQPNADVARNMSSPETAKPKRRRSKGAAAAAASTTFLNASISNFRALVQQHTGCHNTTNLSNKGPITLCFAIATPPASTHQPQPQPHINNQYYYS